MVKYAFTNSVPGKAGLYVAKVAMDLVKARRKDGFSGKVIPYCNSQKFLLDKHFTNFKAQTMKTKFNTGPRFAINVLILNWIRNFQQYNIASLPIEE